MVLGAGVALVLSIAWWWPGLTGQDSQLDVAIVPSSSMNSSQDVIQKRLREIGLTIAWTQSEESAGGSRGADSCSIPEPMVEQWEILVIGLPDVDICEESSILESMVSVKSEYPDRRVVAVLSWRDVLSGSDLADSLTDSGIHVVDARDAIGRANESQECFWWDDCPVSGRIETIQGTDLTEAGRQRLARHIVAGVL